MNRFSTSVRPLIVVMALQCVLIQDGFAQAEKERAEATQEASRQPHVTSSSPSIPATGPQPGDLDDPAFDVLIDIRLLGKAWQRHDPALLTDIGLQLASAERVLLRHHKAIDSERVLELAAYIAADRRDQETLERLLEASKKDKRLGERIKNSRGIAEKARLEDHPISQSMEDLTPEGLAVHQAALRQIRTLRLLNDVTTLDALDKHLDTRDELHESQQRHIDKAISEARSSMNTSNRTLQETVKILDRISAMGPSYRTTRSPR